jgi:hypothetical protein
MPTLLRDVEYLFVPVLLLPMYVPVPLPHTLLLLMPKLLLRPWSFPQAHLTTI